MPKSWDSDVHQYLAQAWPEYSLSLATVRQQGGPWGCPFCDGQSLLCYRCSRCGKDLVGRAET